MLSRCTQQERDATPDLTGGLMAHYEIDVDGPEVSITGTTQGDPIERDYWKHTAWKWSRSVGAFILPRNLRVETRDRCVRAFVAHMATHGRDTEVRDTERVETATERRDAQQDRLEHRLDRHEHRAERAAGEAAHHFAASRQISDGIPFGQPILVGHHSERRHRRDLARMDSHDQKWIAAEKTHERAQQLADGLRHRLERGDSMGTVRRRIDKHEAELRQIDRRLNGTGKAVHGEDKPATGAWRDRLLARQTLLADEVKIDRALLAQMEADGRGHVWTRTDFRKGDIVRHSTGAYEVLRVNAKSVTVPHYFIAGHTTTIPYDDVKARTRDGITWDGKCPDPQAAQP
jgi:hypothetical protein